MLKLKSVIFAAVAASLLLAACGTPPTPKDTGLRPYQSVEYRTQNNQEVAWVVLPPVQPDQSVVLIVDANNRLARIEVRTADGTVVARYLPYVGLSVPVVEFSIDGGVTYRPLGDGILPYSSR